MGFTMKGVNGKDFNDIEGELVNAGNAQTYDFRGMPNNGRIAFPIVKDQIILTGNPYPSTLDLKEFLTANKSITGIAYFWDSRKDGNSHNLDDYVGGYAAYSPVADMFVPAIFKKGLTENLSGETGKIWDPKNLEPGRGFMVIGNLDGEVFFSNDFRKENVKNGRNATEIIQSFKLNFEIDSNSVRQLGLAFLGNSSLNEDAGMDARMMDPKPGDLSWDIQNSDFQINVLPKNEKELIPLNLRLEKESEVKFYISELKNFDPDRILIYDSKDELYFGIKTGYLKMKIPAGNYKDRFYLTFVEVLPKEDAEEQTEPVENENTPENSEGNNPEIFNEKKPANVLLNTIDIFQNNAQDQLEIKILYETNFSKIDLFSLSGQLIFQENLTTKEKEFYIHTGKLANAIYIIKVKTTDGKEITKKLRIKN